MLSTAGNIVMVGHAIVVVGEVQGAMTFDPNGSIVSIADYDYSDAYSCAALSPEGHLVEVGGTKAFIIVGGVTASKLGGTILVNQVAAVDDGYLAIHNGGGHGAADHFGWDNELLATMTTAVSPGERHATNLA